MRVRDRFIEDINEDEESQLTQRIHHVRQQIKKLRKHLNDTCAIIEPCEFMLIWGSLQRCLICIESCVSLVSDGYVGSANALLRQIYEFLVWAKAGIDSDKETLEKLNAAFYRDDFTYRVSATDILKAVRIEMSDTIYSEAELKEKGKEMYHKYSILTHASNIAQQAPYKQEKFYIILNACLNEVCLLLDTFLVVYAQYLKVLNRPFLEESKMSKKEQGYLWVAKVRAGEIIYRLPVYHEDLRSNQRVLNTFVQVTFIEKWNINTSKLK